jgi:hypothetical protein
MGDFIKNKTIAKKVVKVADFGSFFLQLSLG